jgi:nicotinamidase-related amidase
MYALAKARELGLGFGAGWEKFITMAKTLAGLDITADDPELVPALSDEGLPCSDAAGQPIMVSGYGYNSKRIVKQFRADNPRIAGEDGIWRRLDNGFRNSVGGDFEIELPSGRSLRYPEVRRERKAVADPDNPKKFSHRWVYTALAFDQKRNAVIRKVFYGGLLTENAVQATARDVFGEHLLTLDSTSGIDVLFSSHDEAITEVDQNVTAKDVEQVMSVAPQWMPGLPVAAEAQEVAHYKK